MYENGKLLEKNVTSIAEGSFRIVRWILSKA